MGGYCANLKGTVRVVITVVKKGQLRFNTVVKKGYIRVVITVVKKGQILVVIAEI